MSIILGYDPVTLEERVDLKAAGERLEELGNLRSLSALNEKTELLRLTQQYDDAWDMANASVRQARFTGDRETLLGTRVRRARVAAARGQTDDAYIELTGCIAEAQAHQWGSLEAFALASRGRLSFSRKEYRDALADFSAAVDLLEKAGAGRAELEDVLVAVTVTKSFIDETPADA